MRLDNNSKGNLYYTLFSLSLSFKLELFKMGANMSKALNKIFGTKEMRILMLGLDAAGKTSEYSDIMHTHSSYSNV